MCRLLQQGPRTAPTKVLTKSGHAVTRIGKYSPGRKTAALTCRGLPAQMPFGDNLLFQLPQKNRRPSTLSNKSANRASADNFPSSTPPPGHWLSPGSTMNVNISCATETKDRDTLKRISGHLDTVTGEV